jgi:hypothetical protein
VCIRPPFGVMPGPSGTLARVMDPAGYWDGQAATFDDEPDHGLRDEGVRSAWRRLLLPVLPPVPACSSRAAGRPAEGSAPTTCGGSCWSTAPRPPSSP